MRRKTNRTPTRESILDKAEPVENLGTYIAALLYGRSGTGKTTILGTFPKPILILDISERGSSSLGGTPGVDVIKISSWDEIEEVYWELKNGDHKYKTVGIDSIHSAQSLAIDHVKSKAKKDVEDQTSQRDFGQAGALLSKWMATNYRDLIDDGMNVVFIAHERVTEVDTEDDDESVVVPEIGPRLMPSPASAIVGAVSVVGNTFIREEIHKSKRVGQKSTRSVEYCMRVGPHGIYTTKLRKPKGILAPEYIVDPTYDKLMGVIRGKTTRVHRKTNR